MLKKRIFLIDDHKLFIEGISYLLNQKPDLEVVGWAHSAADFYEIADSVTADLYLIDVHMPGESGMDVTKYIRKNNPKARILALSMHEDSHFVEKMINSGANGYLFKSSSLDELVKAVREESEVKTYLGEEVQKVVFEEMGILDFYEGTGEETSSTLSKREKEILSLIARDFTTQQIAEKLFISVRTVDTHRKNIMTKTNSKSIVGMIKYAIREGLVNY